MDVFGAMVAEQYRSKGKNVLEIVERDDHWIGIGEARRYFTSYPEWTTAERKAMQFMKGKVLDVGCGVGRHALYLQNTKKLDVAGIDISAGAISIAKKMGLRKAHTRSIEQLSGMPGAPFDTIGMFYNNFGLLQSQAKAKRILAQLHRVTTSDARIVADATDPYCTKDILHLRYHALNRRRRRLGGQLRLRLRFKNLIGAWFDYLLVSPQEMRNVLRGTGWKVQKLIKGREGNYIAIIGKT